MTPVSQLIWRNRHRLEGSGRLLLVAPPPDDLGVALAGLGHEPESLCLSRAAHVRMQAAGIESRFSLAPPEGKSWERMVLFQPREKALLDMLLDLCACLLDPGGELWLAGENRAGIKSAGKRIGKSFGKFGKLDSARHCTLFRASRPQSQPPFEIEAYLKNWPGKVAGESITVCGLPGVFAHGRLDAGTRLLLEALTNDGGVQVNGRVLDFACGAGVVGLGLAINHPDIELTLLDDSLLALESARRSLESNGLTGRLVASDGLSELLSEKPAAYDWIVSNPPFHAGVHQDLEITRRFLADCPPLLAPAGRLCLVANAHLPYGRWLSELFDTVQVIAADHAYNVWLASGAAAGTWSDKRER